MKRRRFYPAMLVVFSAFVLLYSFNGRSVGFLSGRPDHRMDTAVDPAIYDIHQIEGQMKEAFITGDSALFLKCYAPDACVLPPNNRTLCGQQGIAQFFKATRQVGIRDTRITGLGLYGQTQDYVTQQGVFENFDGNEHSLVKGKVIIIWKKTDAGWRIYRQMLNFDSQMAPPSSPK